MQENPKSYRINLVRELRAQALRNERRKRLQIIVGFGCFAFLALAMLYSGLTIWKMEQVLVLEERKVDHLKGEFSKYKSAKMIVDKEDVELLNQLQGRGIFWTKKLAALATHLPDNYWITKFSFKDGELRVSGFGFPSSRQEQLLVIDEYLRKLRADTTFSDMFPDIYLNSTERQEEQGAMRIAFAFSAITKSRSRGRR